MNTRFHFPWMNIRRLSANHGDCNSNFSPINVKDNLKDDGAPADCSKIAQTGKRKSSSRLIEIILSVAVLKAVILHSCSTVNIPSFTESNMAAARCAMFAISLMAISLFPMAYYCNLQCFLSHRIAFYTFTRRLIQSYSTDNIILTCILSFWRVKCLNVDCYENRYTALARPGFSGF